MGRNPCGGRGAAPYRPEGVGAVTEDAGRAEELLLVTVRRSGTGIRVEVAGEVDLATAPRLRRALLDAVRGAPPPPEVRVDLVGVAFMDAQGVAALSEGRAAARRAGVGFSVHHPQAMVLRILDVLGLTRELGVVVPLQPGDQPSGTVSR